MMKNTTRRTFLRTSGAAAIGALGVAPSTPSRAATPDQQRSNFLKGGKMAEMLNKEDFGAHLNSSFAIHTGEGETVKAKLVEIKDHSNEQVEAFSLLFKGPKNRPIPHDTQKVRHAKMGELSLFIGPVIYHKTDGTYYETVFNRLATPSAPAK
jgi:hypothetical protein